MADSTSTQTGIGDLAARIDESGYGPYVKGALGFGLLAALPYLLDVGVAGISLGSVLTLKVLILTLVFAYSSQAWNIVSGFTGYFSFGHAAFFGVGAYATQKLAIDFGINPWIGMLVGGGIAVLVALLVGFLNFRYDLKGHYFALATFAIAMLLGVVVRNTSELGGAIGYYRPFPREYGAEYGLLAFQFQSDLPYYYVIFAFLVVVTVVAYALKESQLGLYLFAIRENENAAASVGIPTFRYKMLAISVSAFFTAWAGAFWSMYFEIIRPSTVFGLSKNVEILLPAVVGGLGTVPGAIVGAFFVFPLAEFFRANVDQIVGLDDVVYGVALVLVALVLPNGLISLRERIRERRD
ncbi:branched-chain amino acid ABC transporter permease [Halomarina pelagica]|uniref:branched-chain amino acid ABC transporter permease n=1 Tax=Halomarina pelagica TaxID=2961599 RepID=UPI0020C31571|nr:branched-chain amino acid ABC transporter permease [Halomarina sp. BND7]